MSLNALELTEAIRRNAARNTPVTVRFSDGTRLEVTDWDFEYDPANNVTDSFILDVEEKAPV